MIAWTATTYPPGPSPAMTADLRLRMGDDAVRGAKAYLTEALRRSYTVGRGRGLPDHLYALRI